MLLPLLLVMYSLFRYLRNFPAPTRNVSKFFNCFRFGGHRGSPENAPENTLASFKQAYREGVDLIEFDVGLTKDNVPVVMHDDSLDRTTNMRGLLRDRTLADLTGCNCAANFSPRPGDTKSEPILTVEELVRWARSKGIKMIFDIKDTDGELATQIVSFFERYDLFDSAIVCSFFPMVIYRIKRRDRRILTGITWRRWLITYQDFDWTIRRHPSLHWHCLALLTDLLWMWSIKLWLPQFLGADMVLTDRGDISANYVKRMREKGLKVCAWTVNDELEMAWMTQKLEIPFLTNVPHIAFRVINGGAEKGGGRQSG